jgi:hypothetical protein
MNEAKETWKKHYSGQGWDLTAKHGKWSRKEREEEKKKLV